MTFCPNSQAVFNDKTGKVELITSIKVLEKCLNITKFKKKREYKYYKVLYCSQALN